MSNYRVDRNKWAALTIYQQMANIYAEVGRTQLAASRGYDKQAAAMRALDLFDATAEALAKQASSKLKEVLRAREQFVDAYVNNKDIGFDSYYLPFAMAARRHA